MQIELKINGILEKFTLPEQKPLFEIPFSELAMHCKVAGRTDYTEIVGGDYVYIKFKDNSIIHGLSCELIPHFFRIHTPAVPDVQRRKLIAAMLR